MKTIYIDMPFMCDNLNLMDIKEGHLVKAIEEADDSPFKDGEVIEGISVFQYPISYINNLFYQGD